jgi:lipoprotein NlpI
MSTIRRQSVLSPGAAAIPIARWAGLIFLVAAALAPSRLPAAEDGSADDLAVGASRALQSGQHTNAIALASAALKSDPRNFRAWAVRGRAYSVLKKSPLAIADYSEALKLDGTSAGLFQARGEEYFRVGQFQESIKDFDRYLELMPAQKPHHWQRGISCYYAGQFEEGRKQFELHQTVNAHDVENAVWHYLCVARLAGPAKARAGLIPIEGDSRVPMSQVQALFAGSLKPADVLAAANAGNVSARERNNRLFYAHLYLGLFFEAQGDATAAREHIFKAAAVPETDHYMGDVARCHARVLRTKAPR